MERIQRYALVSSFSFFSVVAFPRGRAHRAKIPLVLPRPPGGVPLPITLTSSRCAPVHGGEVRGTAMLREPRVFPPAHVPVSCRASARAPPVLAVGAPNGSFVGHVHLMTATRVSVHARVPHRPCLVRVRRRCGPERGVGRRGRRADDVLPEPSPSPARHRTHRDHPPEDAHQKNTRAQRGREQPGAAADLVLAHAAHRARWGRAVAEGPGRTPQTARAPAVTHRAGAVVRTSECR